MSDLEQRAVEILNRRRVISFRTASHIAGIKEMEQLYGTESRMGMYIYVAFSTLPVLTLAQIHKPKISEQFRTTSMLMRRPGRKLGVV